MTRIFPTQRGLGFLCAGAPLWLVNSSIALLYLSCLAMVMLTEIFRLRHASTLKLNTVIPKHFVLGKEGSLLTLLSNPSSKSLRGNILYLLPKEFKTKELTQSVIIGPEETVKVKLNCIPILRGDFTLDGYSCTFESPLRMMQRSDFHAQSTPTKVYPDSKENRGLLAIRNGEKNEDYKRNPQRKTHAGEFHSLRSYIPGEDLRQVDWKVSAKRGELIAKNWTHERHPHLTLLIDCGRRMAEKVGAHTRLDHALSAAIQLCHAAADQRDTVSLLAFSNKIEATLVETHPQETLPKLLNTIYPLQPRRVESDYWQVFGLTLLGLKKRSLIILFSDLLDGSDCAGMLNNLAKASSQHLVLCVVLKNPSIQHYADANPKNEDEWFAQGAACHMALQRQVVMEKMKKMGVHVLEAGAENFSLDVVRSYLQIREKI